MAPDCVCPSWIANRAATRRTIFLFAPNPAAAVPATFVKLSIACVNCESTSSAIVMTSGDTKQRSSALRFLCNLPNRVTCYIRESCTSMAGVEPRNSASCHERRRRRNRWIRSLLRVVGCFQAHNEILRDLNQFRRYPVRSSSLRETELSSLLFLTFVSQSSTISLVQGCKIAATRSFGVGTAGRD